MPIRLAGGRICDETEAESMFDNHLVGGRILRLELGFARLARK